MFMAAGLGFTSFFGGGVKFVLAPSRCGGKVSACSSISNDHCAFVCSAWTVADCRPGHLWASNRAGGKNGREFDRFLTVRGLSEREMKATLAIWPIQFATYAEDLGALKSAMERDRALVIAFLTNNGVETKEITQGLPDVIDRQDERIREKSPPCRAIKG